MWLASYADVLRLVTRSYERLLNRRATSVHWRLAFVSKEPIHCSVNVDISVVCVPGCLPCAHARYLFSRGKMRKRRIFP